VERHRPRDEVEDERLNASNCIRLAVTLAILGLASGCGMALRLADSASTASAIKEAGSTLRLAEQTITLSAHIEVTRPPDRTGVMVLNVASSAAEWPQSVHLSQIAFRPQSANYYFTYIDVNRQGHATRITNDNAFSPQIEVAKDKLMIRFRVLRLVDKPYEVRVSLRDANGQTLTLGVRAVEKQQLNDVNLGNSQ
jgi:hypothetical protein